MSFIAFACSKDKSQNGNDSQSVETIASDSDKSVGNDKAVTSGLPTVIDFYATWCGPCKQIAPVFENLKEQYAGKVNFTSVDVDQDVEMASKYNISAMPTFVFLDADGKEITRIVGADQESLVKTVSQLGSR